MKGAAAESGGLGTPERLDVASEGGSSTQGKLIAMKATLG